MHTLRRAPHRTPPTTHLCTHCRHASTKTAPKTAQTRLLLKSTARDLAERSAILRERVHSARRARREDWLLGPLAPDRAAADPDYGCVSTRELKGVAGLKRTRQGRSPYMIGRAEEWSWGESLVEVGDTVVVVAERGAGWRERGRVGRVSEVRKGVGECVIEEMNLVNIRAPPAIHALEPQSPPIRTVPIPFPLSAVRVVVDHTHPDGVTVPTIVEKLVRLPRRKGRFIANSQAVTGEWIKIPGPEDEEETKPEPKTHDIDTLRYEVEEETWMPTLLRAPMPANVIDELRNKYSKHRTRHDPRYQLALENRARRTAEWKAWAKTGGAMLSSPAREAAAKARDEAAMRPRPELRSEVLERIGEVMAGKGIELTEERRREMERNLMREGVVGGGMEEMKGRGEEEFEGEFEDVGGEEAEVQDAMDRLGIDELVIEDGREEREDAREIRR